MHMDICFAQITMFIKDSWENNDEHSLIATAIQMY